VVSTVFGRFGLDTEHAREVFPEGQIQLIGIELAYLTISPISKPNGNFEWTEIKKGWRPVFIAPNRRRGSSNGNLNSG